MHPAMKAFRKAADFVFPKIQKPEGSLDLEAESYQKKSPMDLICNDAMVALRFAGNRNPCRWTLRMANAIQFIAGALSEYRPEMPFSIPRYGCALGDW